MRRYTITECRDQACNGKAPQGARLHEGSALKCRRCGGPLQAVTVVREEDVTAMEIELDALRVSGSKRSLLAHRAADAVRSALALKVPQRLAIEAAEAAAAVVDPERGWNVLDEPPAPEKQREGGGMGYTGRDR